MAFLLRVALNFLVHSVFVICASRARVLSRWHVGRLYYIAPVTVLVTAINLIRPRRGCVRLPSTTPTLHESHISDLLIPTPSSIFNDIYLILPLWKLVSCKSEEGRSHWELSHVLLCGLTLTNLDLSDPGRAETLGKCPSSTVLLVEILNSRRFS